VAGEDERREQPQRLQITFDEPAASSGEEDLDIVLRSAVLVHQGGKVPIPARGLTIGSGADVDVRVEGGEVGPEHARVEATESGHVVVDAASGFGTYVNGDRLSSGERRPLESGDTIAVAQQVFHYVPAAERDARLAPITPVDAGRVRAAHDRFTIGRSPSADLVLDHPTVSAEHAVIRLTGGRTWIEDLGSTTGLRVNGIQLRRTSLDVGDQIAIGPFRIVFDGVGLVSRSAGKGLAITALGINVVADGRPILQPTNLQVRPGELVAIIGESGAGKSTLLKVLAGVNRPTGGLVLAGGEPLETRLPEIGYVPQFDIVHGKLTVREALDYAAQLRLPFDLTPLERTARVKQVLERLQLSERADVLIDLVSGGQRKRAAVGTELLHQPGVLFLDEPTTGLDPGLERRLMELFRELASAGQTVALATHATASLALCDRVIVMDNGVVRYDGTPAGLLESFRVAAFEDVYTVLAGPESAGALGAATTAERPLPPVSRGAVRPVHQPFGYQARVLARRYATLVRRDRRHVRSALIQVPILGLLAAFLFTRGVFNTIASGGTLYTGKSAQLLFLLVIVTLWLGSINAAREVVKERNVLQRELAVGVQIPAYIASKLAVLLTFSGIQTALFSLIVFAIQPLRESLATGLALAIVLILTSWIGVLLGLLVSALAASEDHATGVIPLLLVPQLLLGGAIVTVKDMSLPIHGLADLIPARWAFAAAGRAIHMQARIADDPKFTAVNSYGSHFFTVAPIAFLFVAGLFAVALIGGLAYFLRHPRVDQS
jgi:ABC-type multidrug transport system ATPase subunit/pSer/pThr/pTyr-binding forkhead associated (FHA) protein/ABC-type multidrug transport system permease subunit